MYPGKGVREGERKMWIINLLSILIPIGIVFSLIYLWIKGVKEGGVRKTTISSFDDNWDPLDLDIQNAPNIASMIYNNGGH